MQTRLPHVEAATERLQAEIAHLSERIAVSERAQEEFGLRMLLSETPLADHEYRLVRDQHRRLQTRLDEVRASLGVLILERELSPGREARAEGRGTR